MSHLPKVNPVEALAFGFTIVLLLLWGMGRDVPPALLFGAGLVLGFYLGDLKQTRTVPPEHIDAPFIPEAKQR